MPYTRVYMERQNRNSGEQQYKGVVPNLLHHHRLLLRHCGRRVGVEHAGNAVRESLWVDVDRHVGHPHPHPHHSRHTGTAAVHAACVLGQDEKRQKLKMVDLRLTAVCACPTYSVPHSKRPLAHCVLSYV